jgi:hypothetical protein
MLSEHLTRRGRIIVDSINHGTNIEGQTDGPSCEDELNDFGGKGE